MATKKEEFGIVGLGRMGGNLALQAMEKGMRVIGYSVGGIPEDLRAAGIVGAESLAQLKEALARPRKIFLYIPAGAAVDQLIAEARAVLEPGDILVDGGNSYWGDSIRRFGELKSSGIHFIDLGTSGGVSGARNGACFMAGGETAPMEDIAPILKPLAVEGGYVHAGPPGAGHFTKLVHNGIEFGMLQAIGEGVNLLERYPDELNIPDVLRCWRFGSVIRSWLVDLMEASYRKEGGAERIPSHVDDTGEVNWLVVDAMNMEVPIPVIAESVMQLLASRDSAKTSAKAIAMMRQGFGGHAYGPSKSASHERRFGRVGDFYRESPPAPQAPH